MWMALGIILRMSRMRRFCSVGESLALRTLMLVVSDQSGEYPAAFNSIDLAFDPVRMPILRRVSDQLKMQNVHGLAIADYHSDYRRWTPYQRLVLMPGGHWRGPRSLGLGSRRLIRWLIRW